jgi:ketosteroid isomerase-like protein
MMSNRDVVEAFVEAWVARDAAGVRALLADDVEWHMPPSAGRPPFRGADDVSTGLTGGAAGKVLDVTRMRREIHDVLVDGDRAAITLTMTAPILAGGTYKNVYCWILQLREGRITRLAEYADTLAGSRAFSR